MTHRAAVCCVLQFGVSIILHIYHKSIDTTKGKIKFRRKELATVQYFHVYGRQVQDLCLCACAMQIIHSAQQLVLLSWVHYGITMIRVAKLRFVWLYVVGSLIRCIIPNVSPLAALYAA